MKRIFETSGRAFALSVLFLLAGVIALSTATRRPYLVACTGSWHISKAGHMTEAETHECGVAQAAELADEVQAETRPSPVAYVSREELLPNTLALVVHKHHFRSPPFLQ
ncbi:MAG: hypothetical protein ABSH52_08455 [Terriglobia bacterium]|jgi:hypothetical protein